MITSKFSNGFRPSENDHFGIYCADEFQDCLRRDRARVDRSGLKFSVLVFDLPTRNGKKDLSRDLAQVLAGRLRLTDVVGWFDQGRIGALLFNTPAEGAWTLAEHIGRKLPASESLVRHVYTYPCQDVSVDKGDFGNRAGPENAFFTESRVPQDHLDPDLRADSTNPKSALASLLARPIPFSKRVCDIVLAVMGLILTFPLFLLFSLVIKVISPGPAFFRQERIGYLGKPFTCWKFRTMKVSADSSNHQAYVCNLIRNEVSMEKLDKEDTRIIPFLGNFLRKSCLDELPQLLNVLVGDMSLVGPRPCLPYEYQEYLLWHKRRFDTLPGMTGLWQVSGKNKTTFTEMIRLDITYEQQHSFFLDMKIILKTLPAIITQMTRKSTGKASQANEIYT